MSAAGAEEKARASYEIVAFGGLTVGRRPNMAQLDLFRSPRRPWNSGRIIGPKPPLKPKHVWAIHQPLKNAGRTRDLALFDCGIDARLRGCDLVRLRVSDVVPGGSLRQRATVTQQKTGRPVPLRDHRFDAGCIGRVAGDPWPPRRRRAVPQPEPTGRSHQHAPVRTPGGAMGRDDRRLSTRRREICTPRWTKTAARASEHVGNAESSAATWSHPGNVDYNVTAAGAPCRTQISGEKSHETVLGGSWLLALFPDCAGNDCGSGSMVHHGLAAEACLLRLPGASLGRRSARASRSHFARRVFRALRVEGLWDARTDRAADKARRDRFLPARAQSDLCRPCCDRLR